MSKPRKFYYVVVNKNNNPVVVDGRLPIYWHLKVAKQDFDGWSGVFFKKCYLDI